MAADGTLAMDILFNATGWQQIPTFLNQANLLQKSSAAKFGRDENAVPNDMWSIIVPVGSVFWIASQTAPGGYLICDGSVISRADYADLFAVIGETFGAGDGSTTFALPDLRAAFIRGAGSQNGYSAVFGEKQDATFTAIYGYQGPNYGNADKTTSTGDGTWGVGSTALSGTNVYVRPFNIALTPIIKY